VECAFGILNYKWRISQRPLSVNSTYAVEIAKASVFLHIFVRDRDGLKFEEAMTVTGLENVPDGQLVLVRLTARRVRNTVADYFLRDAGAFPWHM